MIYITLGTKAQLIKMAPVMAKLQEKQIPYKFIFTGQHRETINQLRENFGIKVPDITLYEGKDITGVFQMFLWMIRILSKIIFKKKEIFQEKGIILVHGDTFSTLLGALMGKLARVKVAHIESGLRSFNIFHPFPEELTRLAVCKLSNYYFCPGSWALKNLEKYSGGKINTTYNTLLDSLKIALEKKHIQIKIPKEKYAVASIHRFENIFSKKELLRILTILEKMSKKIKILFILHPPTEKQLKKYKLFKNLEKNSNIELRPRYDYQTFIKLLENSEFLISDGGSNQEETFYLGLPCLLLRNFTERNEGLNQNVVLSEKKIKKCLKFLRNYENYRTKKITKVSLSPSEIIVNNIKSFC